MQDTRRRILEYIKTHGEATVDELRDWLGGITAVTVRHHLDVLRRDGFVDAPDVERRDTPGRPRYVYSLTEKAGEQFPKNYRELTDHLLAQIGEQLDQRESNVIFEGVAARMAAEAPASSEGETFEERLGNIVDYLTEHGYVANCEKQGDGFVLHTCNCPYDRTEGSNEFLCVMDMTLVESLTGVEPQRVAHITEGDHSCSYFLPAE